MIEFTIVVQNSSFNHFINFYVQNIHKQKVILYNLSYKHDSKICQNVHKKRRENFLGDSPQKAKKHL